MITSLWVAILTILWFFAAIGVIGLVSWFAEDTFVEPHPTIDLAVGLLFVGVLSLAPLAILILVKSN